MKYMRALITLAVMPFAADGSLTYELTPGVYRAQPGDPIHTFATVTNTGPEVLYYAYSFVDPGTIPVQAVTGQLPPLTIEPGDAVDIVAGTITTHPAAKVGAYTFSQGVGYHPALGVPDVVEANDIGTLIIVPEPASLALCCLGLALAAAMRKRKAVRANSVKRAE